MKSGKKLQFFYEVWFFYPNYLSDTFFATNTFSLTMVYSVDKKLLFGKEFPFDN